MARIPLSSQPYLHINFTLKPDKNTSLVARLYYTHSKFKFDQLISKKENLSNNFTPFIHDEKVIIDRTKCEIHCTISASLLQVEKFYCRMWKISKSKMYF
ncbi:hypothetical protein RF11_14535 [Thelohanellus kitauei]|uniref:Uncharacterized protein n=1 Tax=Thelohanellus kitauei TaxID=669202 RepID=A0A0C2N1Q6_THEKT|nr:hypothetical protein RF11_14535 [Thelohanellus kitauei]